MGCTSRRVSLQSRSRVKRDISVEEETRDINLQDFCNGVGVCWRWTESGDSRDPRGPWGGAPGASFLPSRKRCGLDETSVVGTPTGTRHLCPRRRFLEGSVPYGVPKRDRPLTFRSLVPDPKGRDEGPVEYRQLQVGGFRGGKDGSTLVSASGKPHARPTPSGLPRVVVGPKR